ncbi:Peptidyl-prolyl cis-trans isomerase CWC27 like protein [Eufriesea mexicana]|uniref:Peptidyl-prolyl cis-trans isomerase CWC27 like protein n=1 Tax=Eufriesea mexicana TaxID=516756 RepID=A0A310S715_9HYME|nr:Peptidyl-prolyl cis-trans isomerase CWC27 like protein [Eufriesea mexicana]
MTLFHSIINGFTTQSGDPASIGEAGKIYGEPLKDKFHTRLHFRRQDLIVTANAGKDDKVIVTEETIYNMLKHKEALADENDRPLYPTTFIKTVILNIPFSDIIPRIIVKKSEGVKDSSKTKTAAVKDFNLLSFGEEADEDEEESMILNKKFSGKGKSAHDHLTDPKLSSQPAFESPGLANKERKEDHSGD